MLHFWQKLNVVLAWISLPLTAVALWLLISTMRKYERRKKQIEKDIHSPGMEEVRHLFKPFLKEHGIKADEDLSKRN